MRAWPATGKIGEETRVENVRTDVDGIAQAGRVAEGDDDAGMAQQRNELLLLNITTGLAVLLVCCAWIAIALD